MPRTSSHAALQNAYAGFQSAIENASSSELDPKIEFVNGRKLYITNGPVADLCLLYVKTDQSRGAHGITALVVDMHAPGVRVAQKMIKISMDMALDEDLINEFRTAFEIFDESAERYL